MKNYRKIVLVLGILYFAAVFTLAVFMRQTGGSIPGRDADIITLNDIARDAENNWDGPGRLAETDRGVDFVLLDTADNILYDSRPEAGHDLTLASAMKKGYLYACVTVNDRIAGYVILKDGSHDFWGTAGIRIIAALGVFGILLCMAAVFFGHFVNKSIILPFDNMKRFAGSIAEGNLDAPLDMDRGNLFGAFTESFDIMREELAESKKREIALARREKELVASLSHDLKTPVTGIKLSCELLTAKLEAGGGTASIAPEDLSEKLDNIYKKADQIDVLVSDLLSSTMEELDELRVACTDENAAVLGEIVHRYDDRKLTVMGDIPEVLIRIDFRRMSQVIGNIISNSYKYAGTKIEITFRLVEEYLEMRIRDFGPGVPEDEISLITNKFYRGRQWAKSKEDGSGLGLYIARMLMEKMDGALLPENTGDGLMITLMIPLS